jgi:prepilin-type processing-associated H-X9-DG protein
LLVVVGICGILLALLLPALQRVRQTALRAACASNLRQLALAVHSYGDAYQHLPAGCAYPFLSAPFAPGVSWHTSILPYVEQDALWARAEAAYRANPNGRSAEHQRLLQNLVPAFLCPAESFRMGGWPQINYIWANTSYLGVAGSGLHHDDGVFHPALTIRLTDITDGTSNTVMIGERPPGIDGIFSGWYSTEGYTICPSCEVLAADDLPYRAWEYGRNCQLPPTPLPLRPGVPNSGCHLGHFWSLHPGGAHFAFADGSVRFLSYNVGPILLALATRAGGEVEEP